MNNQSRSGPPQDVPTTEPSGPDPIIVVEAGDDGTVEIVIDVEAAVENLVDVLAENPALLRHLNSAVVCAENFNYVSAQPPFPTQEQMLAYQTRKRAEHVAELVAHPEIRASLRHILDEDQATDLIRDVRHELTQLAGAEFAEPYDPHAIERVDLEDQWTESVP